MPGTLAPLQIVGDRATMQNFDTIIRAWPAEPTYTGTGTPNGVVTGGPGAEYTDLATGARWIHVASTVSNTGWVLQRAGAITATVTGAVSLPANAALGGISKIALNTVAVDTNTWWNTGTARYVPQIAGRYLVTAQFHGTAAGTAGATVWDLVITVNGAAVTTNRYPVNTGYGPELLVAGQVILNGSTDYVELWGAQSASATAITGTERLDIAFLGSA